MTYSKKTLLHPHPANLCQPLPNQNATLRFELSAQTNPNAIGLRAINAGGDAPVQRGMSGVNIGLNRNGTGQINAILPVPD